VAQPPGPASTWTDLADDGPTPARTRLLAIPLGSTEQHGPHLPLDTDTRIAQALTERLAAARSDIVVGPALAIGASGEHAGFPGTLSIGAAALEAVLVELCRSADAFAGVVIVNGHGGNADALRRAVALVESEGRAVLGWSWTLPGDLARVDAHAGFVETSLLLAIAPEVVRASAAEVGDVRPLPELWEQVRQGGVRTVSESGVLGDPRGATAGHGAALLDLLTERLVAAVAAAFPLAAAT
jgi:creatinine amidohydrolase